MAAFETLAAARRGRLEGWDDALREVVAWLLPGRVPDSERPARIQCALRAFLLHPDECL